MNIAEGRAKLRLITLNASLAIQWQFILYTFYCYYSSVKFGSEKSEWHRNSEKSFLKFAYAIFYSIRNIFERTMAKGKKQRKQGQDSDSEWVKMALFSKFQNPRNWKSQEEAAVEHFTRGLHTRISLIMRFFLVKAIINLCKNCWIVKNQG